MNTLSAIVNLSSISCLKALTEQQVTGLNQLNITRLSDLLNFKPIVNAKILMTLANGDIVFDVKNADLLDDAVANTSMEEIPLLPITALKLIEAAEAKIFFDHFRIQTIEELSSFKAFTDAERIVFKFSNEFSEPSSAPDELMPQMLGNVQSSVNFSSFIKEKTIKFRGLELVYDDQKNYIDVRLAALFPVLGLSPIFSTITRSTNLPSLIPPVPEIQLGFITKMSQKWVNVGTHLGEVIHSLPLAPGESRNIAVIDWKRKQATQRTEDTTANEQLTNALFHKRALDEVTRSTADEHQFGRTDIAAGTIATAGAGVVGAAVAGGVAGTLPGAAIGAVVGGVAGAIAVPGIGEIPGIPAGALAGAVIGFSAGAAISGGAALIGAANAQLGTIQADSSGNREIVGSLSQSIAESTVQKASSVRSLWSTVVVTDEQAENERLSTRNVTNYNHSHALTIQYFEVLQHYKSEISLTAAEPILLLPFKPLEFTIDFIADFWDVLSHGIRNLKTRKEYDAIINGIELEEELGSPKIEYINVRINRLGGGLFGGLGNNLININLSGIPGNKTAVNDAASFSFSEPADAELLKGVQLLHLFPGELAQVVVRTGLVNNLNTRNIVTRTSDVLTASSSGVLNFNFTVSATDGLSDDLLQRKADEIERYFNSHRYFFTRLLLLSIEKEQLIDLVESLMLRTSIQVRFPGTKPTFPNFSSRPFSPKDRMLPDTLIESTRGILYEELDKILIAAPTMRLSPSERKVIISALLDEVFAAVEASDPSDPKDPKNKNDTLDSIKARVDKKLETMPELTDKVKGELNKKIKDVISAGFRDIGKVSFTDNIHLSEFIDTTPFAITGNMLIFKMKRVTDPQVLNNNLVVNNDQVRALKAYPEDISAFVKAAIENIQEKKKHTRNADVFLPTSGVFAEAILGRSNASEKIDITRFFNWQESPIPHLAPSINALTAGSRQSESLPTAPTVPGNVLNIVNPAAFPDPTGLTAALSAIQNGNIFRDMSKSDQLVTVMSNLSNLAQSMANQAGSLAGNAQTEALRAAVDIGKSVAQLAAQSASQPANLPTTPTGQGGAANSLEKLFSSRNGDTPQNLEAFKKILGVGETPPPLNANDLFQNKGDISDILNEFARSGVGDLKFNSGGESIELKKSDESGVKNAGFIKLGTDELPENIDFWGDLFFHQVPLPIKDALEQRELVVQDFFFAEEDIEASSSPINLDNYEVLIERMPVDVNGNEIGIDVLYKELRIKFDSVLQNSNLLDENPFAPAFLQLQAEDGLFDGITSIGFLLSRLLKTATQAEFGPHDVAIDLPVWESNNPLGAVMRFDTFPDDMGVVAGKFSNENWIFSTIKDKSRLPFVGSLGDHPVSGNRQFGFFKNPDNKFVLFTKGADRSTGKIETALMQLTFFGGEILWLSFQVGLKKLVESKGGQAKILRPFSKRFEFEKVLEHFRGITI
jgi:hypothetical protein